MHIDYIDSVLDADDELYVEFQGWDGTESLYITRADYERMKEIFDAA